MDRLAGRPIFSVGERVFTWDDVVLAAHVWGDIARLEALVAAGLGAERRLAKARRAPSDDDVDEAADGWRYERDLISADDLESWLSARSLTSDEWLAWVRRALSAATAPVSRAKRPPPADAEPLMLVESMCSGLVTEVIDRLAGRAAVSARVTSERGTRPPVKAKLDAALAKLPSTVRRRGLFGLSAAETASRTRAIVEMDGAHERFAKSVSSTAALAKEIGSHGLDWTRVDADTMTFDTEGAAREAMLLVREDGLTFAKAASVAASRVVPASYVLGDLEPAVRDRLRSAQPGELVGPLATDDAFIVMSVTARIAPSVDDPDIRARARDEVERRAVGAEIENQVRWHERF